MFSRFTSSALLRAPLQTIINRQFSSKAIKMRINSITNIRKITNSMKMVASAKMKKSEDSLKIARAWAGNITDVFVPAKQELSSSSTYLLVPLCSDRGLCGSINSSITRELRKVISQYKTEGKNFKIVAYGEKGRSSLDRVYAQHFSAAIVDVLSLKVINFKQTTLAIQPLLQQEYDLGEIYYNKFKNAVSFILTKATIQPSSVIMNDKSYLSEFGEQEGGQDLMQNLNEFTTAIRFYLYMCETDTSEQSSRMNAMGNSTKSAGEMLDHLRLLYNRRRQAKITTELIEIISGAVALEDEA